MGIAAESVVIAAIGILDLATTLIWVQHHGAQEGNPIFRYYLALGPHWFAVGKIILLAGPIFVLEWARRRQPRFTLWASRLAIAGYLGLYGLGVLHLNPQLLQPRRVVAQIAWEPNPGSNFPGQAGNDLLDLRPNASLAPFILHHDFYGKRFHTKSAPDP
ncbi:MAG: DUF5658 family protein [Chthonomonadales bacterium]